MDRKEAINLFSRFIPRKTVFFDVIVTEHCNLNCKGCGSFVPLAEKEYINIEELEMDLNRISELSHGVMHHINLLGGEPLLHPEIKRIMGMVRRKFNYGIINLVTNGILLPQMDSEFWNVCCTNRITICPTKYPINVDYLKCEELAKRYNVEYKYFGDVTQGGWIHKKIDLGGSRYENSSFMYCSNANMCPVLKHGKIFPCPTVAHIEKFNKAFKLNLNVDKSDYIDIYNVKNLDEIMFFLTRPIPFCRYCNTPAITQDEWGISHKDIKEWV